RHTISHRPSSLPPPPSHRWAPVFPYAPLFRPIASPVFYALRKPGLVAGIFAIGYALARMLVELVRLPDGHIGYLYGEWLTMGQLDRKSTRLNSSHVKSS